MAKKTVPGALFILIFLSSLSLLASCSVPRIISLNVTNNTTVDAVFLLVQCDKYAPPKQIEVNAGATNYIANYEIEGPSIPGTMAAVSKFDFGFKFFDKSNNFLQEVTGNIGDVSGNEFSVALDYDAVNDRYSIKITPQPYYLYCDCP